MAYTPEDIRHMNEQLEHWLGREARLSRGLLSLPLPDGAAREMMQHGVSRRLADLEHLLQRVFEVLPPDEEAPSQDALRDATAFLQAFVINTFGVMDNFAWLWALRADVRGRNGRPLYRSHIGLTPSHVVLRASLSQRTQRCLQAANAWFAYLEDYRHALAHRIPLYIPPKTLDEEGAAEFRRLGEQVGAEGWDWARWGEILVAQRALGVFQPVMTHSYGERARPVLFHGQIICDFATVIDVGEHILQDLLSLPGPADRPYA